MPFLIPFDSSDRAWFLSAVGSPSLTRGLTWWAIFLCSPGVREHLSVSHFEVAGGRCDGFIFRTVSPFSCPLCSGPHNLWCSTPFVFVTATCVLVSVAFSFPLLSPVLRHPTLLTPRKFFDCDRIFPCSGSVFLWSCGPLLQVLFNQTLVVRILTGFFFFSVNLCSVSVLFSFGIFRHDFSKAYS